MRIFWNCPRTDIYIRNQSNFNVHLPNKLLIQPLTNNFVHKFHDLILDKSYFAINCVCKWTMRQLFLRCVRQSAISINSRWATVENRYTEFFPADTVDGIIDRRCEWYEYNKLSLIKKWFGAQSTQKPFHPPNICHAEFGETIFYRGLSAQPLNVCRRQHQTSYEDIT